jgi:hypothetical protein
MCQDASFRCAMRAAGRAEAPGAPAASAEGQERRRRSVSRATDRDVVVDAGALQNHELAGTIV